MRIDHVLLMTDVVDSTQLSERLGDDAAAALWQAHDRITRTLLRQWRGREIDKSDGFLLLFDSVADALGCALATHQALAALQPPLRARAGIHVGALRLRPNSAADIQQGAKPLEVDGIAKPLAARIMAWPAVARPCSAKPRTPRWRPAAGSWPRMAIGGSRACPSRCCCSRPASPARPCCRPRIRPRPTA